MDQTVYTVNDLCKCAEGHHANDLNGCNVTLSIGVGEYVPRIGLCGLVAQRNSLLLLVEALNEYGQYIADSNNVSGRLDSLPGQLGCVNHTVNAAQVDKRTVRGHALNSTGVNLAFLDLVPESFLCSLALCSLNQSDGALSLLALTDLKDSQLNGGVKQNVQIAVLGNAGLRCVYEHAIAVNGNDNAALNNLDYSALQHFLGVLCANDSEPVLVRINALLGKFSNSLDVADTNDKGIYLVTSVESVSQLFRRIINLLGFDVTRNACAEVQLDLCIGNVFNGSGNDISCI